MQPDYFYVMYKSWPDLIFLSGVIQWGSFGVKCAHLFTVRMQIDNCNQQEEISLVNLQANWGTQGNPCLRKISMFPDCTDQVLSKSTWTAAGPWETITTKIQSSTGSKVNFCPQHRQIEPMLVLCLVATAEPSYRYADDNEVDCAVPAWEAWAMLFMLPQENHFQELAYNF